MGAEVMLTETANAIEQAQADVKVFEAMKQGDKVLKELRSQVTLEKFEELYDDHKDALAQQEAEQELFGEVLDEEEIQAELDKLLADDI